MPGTTLNRSSRLDIVQLLELSVTWSLYPHKFKNWARPASRIELAREIIHKRSLLARIPVILSCHFHVEVRNFFEELNQTLARDQPPSEAESPLNITRSPCLVIKGSKMIVTLVSPNKENG